MGLNRKIGNAMHWLRSRRESRGAFLLYHRVAEPERDPFRLCVSPANFEAQMRVLAEFGKALSLREFLDRRRRGCLEIGSVCVTFDDGYLDVFRTALPILEAHGIPATVFVTTGNLGQPFWWDRLDTIAGHCRHLPGRVTLSDGSSAVVELEGCETQEALRRLSEVYLRLEPDGREAFLARLESLIPGGAPGAQARAASEDELRSAALSPLLDIEAHTVSHTRLSALPLRGQIEEIGHSAECLTGITGTPVTAVSYPFGLRGRDYNGDTLQAVSAAGLEFGFTADRRVVTVDAHPLTIPRLWIRDRTAAAFRNELAFWLGAAFSRSSAPNLNEIAFSR